MPVWQAFDQGKIYTASADGSVVSSSFAATATVSGCTVTNAVKEVFYTVKYQTTSAGLFKIKSIIYDIVLQDSVLFTQSCSGGTIDPTKPELYKMKFGIAFEPYTTSSVPPRSGNPGYVPQQPLLVSYGEDAQGVQQLGVSGYFARSSDSSGKCIRGTTLSSDVVRVDFENDILLSCQVGFADVTAFETYCNSGDLLDFSLIKQFIDEFKYVGIFGNANIANKQDWIQVITSEVDTVSGVFDSTNDSCLKKDSLQIEVLHSQVGFKDDPQDYIVGVQMSTQTSEWIYGASDSVYTNYVSIAYREIEHGLMLQNELISIMNVNGELFYPLMLGNT